MVLITQSGPGTLSLGTPGPDFNLPATDGQTYSLESFASAKAVVLMPGLVFKVAAIWRPVTVMNGGPGLP